MASRSSAKPPGVHFKSTIASAEVSDEFIMDLKSVVADFKEVKVMEKCSTAEAYNMVATIPSLVVAEVAGAFVDALYKP